jgi:hypothetical protein
MFQRPGFSLGKLARMNIGRKITYSVGRISGAVSVVASLLTSLLSALPSSAKLRLSIEAEQARARTFRLQRCPGLLEG